MAFSDTLRELRERQGWSKSEAARRIGMERTQYLRMEAGTPKRPEYETLVRIADAYGVPPVTLIEATGQTVMESAGRYMVDVESDELLQLFDRMDEHDRRRLVAIARALYQLSRE